MRLAITGAQQQKQTVSEYNGFTDSQRNRANAFIKAKIMHGFWARPAKCCACGQGEGWMTYHVEDYNEPFNETLIKYPVCYICRMMILCRFKQKKVWLRYCEDLHAGKIFPVFMTSDWFRFVALFLEREAPFKLGDPRTELIFDIMGPNRTGLALERVNLVRKVPPAQIQTQLL